MKTKPYTDEWLSISDGLPPRCEWVKVKCTNQCCLGYLDNQDVWHWGANDQKLEEVLAWRPREVTRG